jgi:acyl-CoA reductase-like NAD-dependent aldehyde dehydrogenase
MDSPQLRIETAQRRGIAVTNPITGERLGQIVIQNAEEVQAAAERARVAQSEWAARSVKERANLIRRWWQLTLSRQPQVIEGIRRESGKNEASATAEFLVIELVVDFYCRRAPRILRSQSRRALIPIKQYARVHYVPYGVVGVIAPWNYPFFNAFVDLLPALIAGNTILLKPSEVTPLIAQQLVSWMHEAGIPRDVIQVVTGDGSTGAALVDAVDYIAFTGSTETGRRIAIRAAERLIPCTLELGGKDPLIVLRDADVELAAVSTLKGALENAGQMCVSVERVYVEAPVYDLYVQRLQHHIAHMQIGSAPGLDTHMGSMTNARELHRVEAQLEDAVSRGARILFGGKRRPDLGPLFFEPTLVVDVDHRMNLMRDETFGPVIPVMRVQDAAEAIRLANDSPYGLSGSVFTRDLRQGEQVARRIQSGDVTINTTNWTFGTVSVPMGGVKQSGLGRRNGAEGLLRFVHTQSIVVDNGLLTQPTPILADRLTVQVAVLLRHLRRWIPFLRL